MSVLRSIVQYRRNRFECRFGVRAGRLDLELGAVACSEGEQGACARGARLLVPTNQECRRIERSDRFDNSRGGARMDAVGQSDLDV